ncbi:MAG: hypothetical protein M3R38_35095 [Actinomycetota bacterium]|nr:hypothetical protein [Actinomycetota bacterium]
MQQSTNANIEQRVEHALAQVRSIIDEYEELCSEQVAAAEAKAQGDRARFAEASEQLTDARRELAALEEERASLPLAAYTAGMGGDTARERELRARYTSIAPEHLEALRRSCGELEAEKNALGGTESGAEKRALKNVRAAYASVLQSTGEFEGRIDLLKSAAEELRSKLWNGQRGVEEQQNFLRAIEREERRGARVEAARRSEVAGHATSAPEIPRFGRGRLNGAASAEFLGAKREA